MGRPARALRMGRPALLVRRRGLAPSSGGEGTHRPGRTCATGTERPFRAPGRHGLSLPKDDNHTRSTPYRAQHTVGGASVVQRNRARAPQGRLRLVTDSHHFQRLSLQAFQVQPAASGKVQSTAPGRPVPCSRIQAWWRVRASAIRRRTAAARTVRPAPRRVAAHQCGRRVGAGSGHAAGRPSRWGWAATSAFRSTDGSRRAPCEGPRRVASCAWRKTRPPAPAPVTDG